MPYFHVEIDFESGSFDSGELFKSLNSAYEQLSPFWEYIMRFVISLRSDDGEELLTF